MLDSRADVRAEHAVFVEQQAGEPRDRRRTVDLEIRDPAGAHVPALEHQARIVHEVVVVEMREERARDVHGAASALDQPLVGAGTVIEDQRVARHLDEVARALTLE